MKLAEVSVRRPVFAVMMSAALIVLALGRAMAPRRGAARSGVQPSRIN